MMIRFMGYCFCLRICLLRICCICCLHQNHWLCSCLMQDRQRIFFWLCSCLMQDRQLIFFSLCSCLMQDRQNIFVTLFLFNARQKNIFFAVTLCLCLCLSYHSAFYHIYYSRLCCIYCFIISIIYVYVCFVSWYLLVYFGCYIFSFAYMLSSLLCFMLYILFFQYPPVF